MKNLVLLLIIAATLPVKAGEIFLQKAQGNVTVRRGVTESWMGARTGDSLSPDATIKIGMKSSAVLVARNKTITLPPEVIVDMSDVRNLTQEELMLKLTMQKVRSSSYQWKKNDLNTPNITPVHGPNQLTGTSLAENDTAEGALLLNGTRVLFNNGFYSTCALKTLEVLRRFPSLDSKFEYRWLAAEALEKSNVKGEALTEYVALSNSATLTQEQRNKLAAKIEQLKTAR